MNLIICTTLGLVVIAAILASFFGVIWGMVQLWQRFLPTFEVPAIVGRLAGILCLAIAGVLLLLMSHEIGCKVIHLTARH